MNINKLISRSVDELLDDDFINDEECKGLSAEIAVAQEELERTLQCPDKLEGYAEFLHQRTARMIQIAYMRGKADVRRFLSEDDEVRSL